MDVYLQGSLCYLVFIVSFPVCIPFSAVFRAVLRPALSHVRCAFGYIFTVMTRV